MIRFFYPGICLHCQQTADHLFCLSCAPFFELLDPNSRCPFCFLEKEEGASLCYKCKKAKELFFEIGAALDYSGAVATLIKNLKYKNMPFLAETAAPFMLLQFTRLKWELPDLIIPVPRSPLRSFFYGYNQSLLLAAHLGKILQVKVATPLKRKIFTIPQAHLNLEDRENLDSDQFSLSKNETLKGKNLLLIDDVATTLSTLKGCAYKLLEAQPKNIRALCLARTPLISD